MRTQIESGRITYRLLIAYDGTEYHGWQAQHRGDTIQVRIEEPLQKIFGKPIRIHGAGRTDAGVHARGQVASFQTTKQIAPTILVRALNAHLPRDIRILKAAFASTEFHARFSATSKEYRYQIDCAAAADPFLRRYALHHPRPLNISAMRRSARRMVGRHNFIPFSAKPPRGAGNTMHTVSYLTIRKEGELLTMAVRADGFCYKMVRSMVGALLKAGRGEATTGEIERYFRNRKRTHFVETAPAHGLFLWKVWYG